MELTKVTGLETINVMKVVIVRRESGAALSMDVYTDGLVAGLKTVRPDWRIFEIAPTPVNEHKPSWSGVNGFRKYYERFWQHPRAVTRQPADIVHIIDHTSGHIARWLKKTNPSVVVTCHDLVQLIYPENTGQTALPQLSLAAWRFSVWGMKQCDHVIVVSSNTAKDVRQFLNIESKRITVVPNAVDSRFCVLAPEEIELFRQQKGISPKTICLLNVGSTHPRKNMLTILTVLEALKNQGLSVCLWKVGSDFTAEQKTFIQNHDLENFITYFGKPDKSTLVQIYNAVDVLLSPSIYEGFGFTILEAMACGTPVVTSNVSSLPEVAGNAAILVEPMDVQAMSEAICHLQSDSNYRCELINKGLARARLFTWERTAEQVAIVYEKLIHQQKAGNALI